MTSEFSTGAIGPSWDEYTQYIHRRPIIFNDIIMRKRGRSKIVATDFQFAGKRTILAQ